MTKKDILREVLRPLVIKIISESLTSKEESMIQDVIDTYKYTKSGKMALGNKSEYNAYKKIADKTGFLIVNSGFPSGTYSVQMSDSGIKQYNLTPK